jgi:chorismate mutase/prephenate dehydratase
MQLKNLRKRIDKIDQRILKLLNQRVEEVIQVSKLKKANNLKAYAPEREAKLLRRLGKLNKGILKSEDVNTIFGEILSICRSKDTILKIAYLGPEGTFTHLAAMKKFGKKPKYIPAESIGDVFDKVEKLKANYGVVPIENSTEGVVNHTLDMFLSSPLNICAEVTLNISHVLLGKPLKQIKKVYSNPQVFAQCRRWISRSLKKVELIPVSSTARAALEAKKDRYGACIGNKALAGLYGLKLIASGLEDTSRNYTRFLIIAKNDTPASGKDKTSILFSVKDRVGALYDVLSSFKSHGINLTKIESRPSKLKAWEYYFFVDFKQHKDSPKVKKALRRMEKECVFVKILGSYPEEQ